MKLKTDIDRPGTDGGRFRGFEGADPRKRSRERLA